MSLMLGDMAVTAVVKRINHTHLPCFEGRAYKYERPEKEQGEYIAVNHLPFVHRGEVEKGTVNVNIHVPKLRSNLPNIRRLAELSTAIAELFPQNCYIDKAFYEFYADSRPTPDNDGTYYINIQLQVTYNDLNY